MRDNKYYLAIREFYGERRAARSSVPLIAHIDEGLGILELLGSSLRAREAFCIHPMLQDDNALRGSIAEGSLFRTIGVDPAVVALAMEYRAVANAYQAYRCVDAQDAFELSCLVEVNHMLIADKVQNRRDFERYHLATHPRSATLDRYFKNWLRRLDISEERYRDLVDSLVARSTPVS
jgi:hypothetical protein